MRVCRTLGDVRHEPRGRALAIGVFDGVHLGHRAVIAAARQLAESRGLAFVVLTFDPHPRSVLAPDEPASYLTGPDVKAELIAELGAAELIVMPFTRALARVRAERFAEVLIAPPIGAAAIAVGENFRFGNQGAGDPELLRRAGRGRSVEVVSPEMVRSDDGERISSTRIRSLVAAGDVREAAALLGRDHLIEGPVIAGAGRGRTLGVPTANLDLPVNQAVPAPGVYAARLVRGDDSWPAAVNVGRAPTFSDGDGALMVEAHAIGYTGPDFYGEQVRIVFRQRLRNEKRFSGPDELVAQIRRDIADAASAAG